MLIKLNGILYCKGKWATIFEETPLEIGKDYICVDVPDLIVMDRKGDKSNYGFINGTFSSNISCETPSRWKEAIREEVVIALKKEATKRYGKDWGNAKIKRHASGYPAMNAGTYPILIYKCPSRGWLIQNKNGLLYRKGIWAEMLPEDTVVIGHTTHFKDNITLAKPSEVRAFLKENKDIDYIISMLIVEIFKNQ